MGDPLYDKASETWESLVAAVCDEYRAGALSFGDAVDDLLFLGFDRDEAHERLRIAVAADPAERMTPELV